MGTRFRKSKQILPGVRLNVGKKSASVSIGPKGLKHTISTTGKSPALSKHLRQQFESELDGDIEKVLDKMGLLRQRLKKLISDQKTRSEILKRALDCYLKNADDDLTVEKMIAEYTE